MEKTLRIEAFRNIGFLDEKPAEEKFLISNSFKKGEIGDLVILIGANNSGKSNVLDALKIMGEKQFSKHDVTDLFMEENCRTPTLSLCCKSDNGKEKWSLRKEYAGNVSITFPEMDENLKYTNLDNIQEEFENLVNSENQYDYDGSLHFSKLSKKLDWENFNQEQFRNLIKKCFEIFEQIQATKQAYNRNHNCNSFISRLESNKIYKDFYSNKTASKEQISSLEDSFQERFNTKFQSNIKVYEERKTTNDDLSCAYDNLKNSDFFKNLFHAINTELEIIENTYKVFQEQNNKGILKQLEKKLNSKLKKVSKHFNQLYYFDDKKYSFEFSLESEKIFFSVFREEQSLSLDYQSSGFKWFFNLYFGLLNSVSFEAGDIIIMDEPATNLHVKGQRELRSFMKNFAIKNDITIVIATHSPFLIDLDYLDEIRVIENCNNITSIKNHFCAIGENQTDTLKPIRDSLTVENFVICNPEQKVVFVEGVTDYNYLTAMKNALGKTNISFLPINGVGVNDAERLKTSKEIIRIKKQSPILLVDNDSAGQAMKKTNKDSEIEVILLSGADEKFTTIESLFSNEDLEKFNLKEKHSSTSTIFKNKLLQDKTLISEETKANFEKLFNRLCE